MLAKIILIKPQSLDFENKDSSLQKSLFPFFDLFLIRNSSQNLQFFITFRMLTTVLQR